LIFVLFAELAMKPVGVNANGATGSRSGGFATHQYVMRPDLIG